MHLLLPSSFPYSIFMPTLPFLTSTHPYELLNWLTSCPAPFEAVISIILLQIFFILLLTESRSSLWGGFSSPLNNISLRKQLNGDYTPSNYPNADDVSPKKLKLSPIPSPDGPSGSPTRPTVQKLKHGKTFRDSVLKGNDNTASILSSFSHIESYLKKKGGGLSGWQKVRSDEERSDSSIPPTNMTNNLFHVCFAGALPLVASLLALLFALLIAALLCR